MLRNLLTILSVVGTAIAPAAALSQTYPDKPIHIVVPYPSGGGTDVVARSLGEQLAKRLGQPVIIDNKPGAAGMIGTNAVAKAPADGYTLLLTIQPPLLTNLFLYSKMPYDPQKELTLLNVVATGELVLVSTPTLPAKSLRELGSYAKANKGKVNYGSWGVGSYPHLASAYLSNLTQSDMQHVSYKGEMPMLQDVIGGQIQFGIVSVMAAKAFIDTGRVTPLAIMGSSRSALLPGVPTAAEAGYEDAAFKVNGWIGFLAPAGTPAPILSMLDEKMRGIIKTPAIQARFASLGMRPIGSTPAESQATYARDLPVVKSLVQQTGAKLD